MDVHVCLLNGSQISVVLLAVNCTYAKLVDTVMTEFNLDPTKVAVTIQYLLNNDLPQVRIRSDSNVLSYITLKVIDRDPSRYPLSIDVTLIEQQSITIPVAAHTTRELSLQRVVSDICTATVEPVGHISEEEVTIVTTANHREVEEGKVFRDKEVLKLSLSLYAIQNMFEFVVVRSDKKEYVVKCLHDVCTWMCRSSKWGKSGLFKIGKFANGHMCGSNIILGSHRQLSSTVISSSIKYKYTSSSNTIYTPKDICSDMFHMYGVSLNYSKAWRCREQTLKIIRGDPTESFGKIHAYFHMLEQRNPGTVTGLELDGHSRFKYCFMALGASIRGWKHCRPVVVVDGTYLNGHYGGTLFTACTQDVNNSIFILAFGIGDSENDRAWTWFFENLKKAYGVRDGLCFVSDRHVSIKNAIEHVYLGTCHGICSYHLLQNLKSYYGKTGHNITQAFNTAVRSYTLSEFEYHMQQLDMMNGHIMSYLEAVGLEKWSRFHMPANRYSTMTSNIVESVNAVTKAAKDEHSSFVVDIYQRTCTCRMFQVDLFSCPHALAVIAHTKRDPYEYCSYYYTKDAYMKSYQEFVIPVGDPSE